MFLGSKEKDLKSKALESLMSKIDEMDNGKLSGSKEVTIAEVKPVDGEGDEEENELGEYMKEAGHEGVEAEEAMTVTPEQKAMIEELYNKFVRV